jgi:hypothetical protein
MIGVKAQHPVDDGAVGTGARLQPVPHEDPLQNERAALEFYFTGRVGVETTVSGWDATRFQRATQRPGQSTSRRRDDVIQRGRVRLILALPPSVVRGDLPMDAEHHRRVLGRHPGVPQRPASSVHLHMGPVDNITHDASSLGTGTLIVSPQAYERRTITRTAPGLVAAAAQGQVL